MKIVPNLEASRLTDDEKSELIRDEATIERLGQAYWEAGNALRNIRDKRLYRAQYATFDDYCRSRWGMERTYAHRLIEAVRVRQILLPIGNILGESPESSMLPIGNILPESGESSMLPGGNIAARK